MDASIPLLEITSEDTTAQGEQVELENGTTMFK